MGAAPIGAGMAVAGTGINAYGQNQGLKAKRDAWNRQMEAQRAYDAQLRAKTDAMIAGIGPQTTMGGGARAEQQIAMDQGVNNAHGAVQRQAATRSGGARGGTEARASSAQSSSGALARALQGNHLAALLAGLQQGGRNIDLLGRQYAGDAGRIRGDAQRWASLVPLQQQAAGMEGGWARQIGTLFNMGGQGLMSYGMSQPVAQMPTSTLDGLPYHQAAISEMPEGGWAVNRTPYG